jgi:hypothetical protein
MSLGHVYDLDLKRNESIIKDVIIQAQGEVRLIWCQDADLYIHCLRLACP